MDMDVKEQTKRQQQRVNAVILVPVSVGDNTTGAAKVGNQGSKTAKGF